jgi:hypothetical protein
MLIPFPLLRYSTTDQYQGEQLKANPTTDAHGPKQQSVTGEITTRTQALKEKKPGKTRN